MQDKLDLYNKAREAPNPSLPKGSGSWDGHIEQLEGKLNALRKAIRKFDKKKCRAPVLPQSVRDLVKQPIPTRPGGKPGYPFTVIK